MEDKCEAVGAKRGEVGRDELLLIRVDPGPYRADEQELVPTVFGASRFRC